MDVQKVWSQITRLRERLFAKLTAVSLAGTLAHDHCRVESLANGDALEPGNRAIRAIVFSSVMLRVFSGEFT
jgi:hypothetical protein